jgi:tetratricopeptide (TPR) repeat protein
VFAVQADLTAQIVAALVSHVQRSEVEAVLARPTESLHAYELVLQGRHEHNVLTAESLLKARDLFTRAVALDPSYAAAHAYLGMTYVKDHALALTGNATARQLQTGIDHIREAIRVQPDLALGYQALSFALAQTGDYESAMRAAERAVHLSPSDASAPMRMRSPMPSGPCGCTPSRRPTTPMSTARPSMRPGVTRKRTTCLGSACCARRTSAVVCACRPPCWSGWIGLTTRGRQWRVSGRSIRRSRFQLSDGPSASASLR